MSPAYDYVAVGHVTIDVIEDAPGGARRQPGGGAFYSALQAARLGLRTLLVTRGAGQELERLLHPFAGELDVEVLPSPRTTTFATLGAGEQRTQRVQAWAGAIEQPLQADASILHFAPVAREITARTRRAWAGVTANARFVAVTPQGLVREWADDGSLRPAPLDLESLPQRIDAAVLNAGERASCAVLLAPDGPAGAGVVAITAGRAAIELRLPDGTSASVRPIEIGGVREDIGAGDVFAAAFFIALARGEPPVEAVRIGSAAAAVRMAGNGPAAVGDANAIGALL